MIARIPSHIWNSFFRHLSARRDVETAGLLFARVARSGETTVLLVEKAEAIPDEAYVIRKSDQLRIDPVALNRLTRHARDRGLAVLTAHTHDLSCPGFSWADDAGDARLMPALQCQIPDVPHGSMVVLPDGRVVARAWPADATAPSPLEVRLVGESIEQPTLRSHAESDRFHRQRLALGADGQAKLRRLNIGVVGVGGIGSVVAFQLAHLGPASVTLVDGDLLEETNLSRVLSSSPESVGSPKIAVSDAYFRAIGSPTKVVAHHAYLEKSSDLDPLRACDVVFSCVDRHIPRALLNEMAYECLIPVIDSGVAFRVGADGTLIAGAGRVVVIGPERPCLACWGHLDPDRLRIEALSDDEREGLEEEGYVQGANVPQPSVVAFNTQVAGAAVAELLHLAAGFGECRTLATRLAFDFLTGTVLRNRVASRGHCRICRGGTHDVDVSRLEATA